MSAATARRVVSPLPASAPPAARPRPAGNGTRVEMLTRPDELAALVADWESLAAEAAQPNPFYEHWMLLPALAAYGAGGLRCFAVWQDGVLAGLFPMRFARGYRGLPVGALSTWRHRNMMIGTPLVREKTATQCIAAFIANVPAALVEFELISTDGPFYAALTEAAPPASFAWFVRDAYARAVLARDRDPRSRFNSNMKNNLRRWEKGLRAAGELEPVTLQPGDDVGRWAAEFMELEAAGWKGKAGTALSCREDDRRFVAEVLPEAHRRGRLRITGLDLAGRALARHIMLGAGDGAFTFKIAYDEGYANFAPGIVGEVENVRQFMERPGPQWLDSNTAPESKNYARVWKERRTIQTIAIGVRALGRVALGTLPFLRLAKRWFS
ncbi:MAG: GNAT family N-acetyltransferase [Betaproteobacteria bacterium]|nr:GNAT family N-acetyltransferase [Betaproteobacteria bacterium]